MPVFPLAPEHEPALEDFLADFDAAGEREVPAFFSDRAWPHAEKVEKLAAWARGEGIEEGWVPCTSLFAFDGSELVGVLNVRHRLTEALRRFGGHIGYSVRPSARRRGHGHRLLAGGVDFARSLGIERVLLTCEPSNTGSVRIIEAAGGILEGTGFHEGEGKEVSVYWIEI